MNNVEEIMTAIMDNDLQIPVLKLLQDWIITSRMIALNEKYISKAALKAIKKINRGKDKDIDSLCEED